MVEGTSTTTATSHAGGSPPHAEGGDAAAATNTEEEVPSDQEDCEWHAHLLETAQYLHSPVGYGSAGTLVLIQCTGTYTHTCIGTIFVF